MKLRFIRLSGFQSFGADFVEISLSDVTYLIGPNGSGKTAVLQALCRMFAFDPAIRRVTKSDFHVPMDEEAAPKERSLWIEVDFEFPELEGKKDEAAVPPNLNHMRLDEPDGKIRVRYRLDATLAEDGEIEESLVYVLDVDKNGDPVNTAKVQRTERSQIHVHYLPARRDPADHITYGTNALLGRLLRAVNWDVQREAVNGLSKQISDSLAGNGCVDTLNKSLNATWSKLHTGEFFKQPQVTFNSSEMDGLLRHLTVSFEPGHGEKLIDFSRMSDGQKSLLYLSLVLSVQSIGREVLGGWNEEFDVDRLKPPIFTLAAVEEPENSLSPHYLGRIVNALTEMSRGTDAQAVIATHAPSMLRRVEPQDIRYLRLSTRRESSIRHIMLPDKADVAHKYVREAVQAFPELYFSRLVILGEGDSEEIVLPRVLRAKGVPIDESAVSIAPLGGRHVNHFWRLLNALGIPHVTLLDLDVARHGGGWGRFKYANDQLQEHRPNDVLPKNYGIPNWDDVKEKVRKYENYIEAFEERNVFFSSPMDLDFAMLTAFPVAFDATLVEPTAAQVKAVLGDSHHDAAQYSDEERRLFAAYQSRFKLHSKPVSHLSALAKLSDEMLLDGLPASLDSMSDKVADLLKGLPE